MEYLPEDYEFWTEDEQREFLLNELTEAGQDSDMLNDMELSELEQEYINHMSEIEATEEFMYPNGRDYDAEDFD